MNLNKRNVGFILAIIPWFMVRIQGNKNLNTMESPELSRINIYKYFINIIKYSLVIVVLAEYINLD